MILESVLSGVRETLYVSTNSNPMISFVMLNITEIMSVTSLNVIFWLMSVADWTTLVCLVGPAGKEEKGGGGRG